MRSFRQPTNRVLRCPRALLACATLAHAACGDSTSSSRHDAGDTGEADAGSCVSVSDRKRAFYWDGDGDGFGVPGKGGIIGCTAEAPPGYSLNALDCDDADPTSLIFRYRDLDADGYGDPNSKTCASASDANYADRAEDCDDNDAARSPAMAEIFRDEIDQDCDGADQLQACIALPGRPLNSYGTSEVLPFPDLSGLIIDANEGCAGADLYFVVLGACAVCSAGKSTVVVGNRGQTAATFVVEGSSDSETVSTPVQPLHLSDPFELDIDFEQDRVEIKLLEGVEDCDRTNNTAELEYEGLRCEF